MFDYSKLIEYIKSYGTWAKPLESFWLIKTTKDATTIRDEIQSKTSSNDKIVVMDVTNINWATSSVSKEVIDWMQKNV
jgi:hypothetical protein